MARWEIIDVNITDDNTTAGNTEPVSVSEVKTFLQLEGTAYDGPIAMFITAARKQIENYCNVSLVPKSIVAKIKSPNYKPFPLPYPPIDAVTTIKWKKCPSELITLTDGDDYDIDEGRTFYINSSEADTQSYNFHEVTYTTLADTDIAYKQAIIAQAAWMYSQRDTVNIGGWSPAALALLNTLRNLAV